MTQDIVLNDRRLTWPQAAQALKPGLAPQAITRAGGLLLAAARGPDALLLRIVPNFTHGRRNYHYDMPLPRALGPILHGDVNPNGTFRLLFPPASLPASTRDLQDICRRSAQVLLAGALPGTWKLTPTSLAALREAGALPNPQDNPQTLAELAQGPDPD
jgi:hypothetical protein